MRENRDIETSKRERGGGRERELRKDRDIEKNKI